MLCVRVRATEQARSCVRAASLRARWRFPRQSERELESLVRGGVPMAIRGELWQLCLRVDEVRVPGAYQTLAALVDADVNDHLSAKREDARDECSLDVLLASSSEEEEARHTRRDEGSVGRTRLGDRRGLHLR